MAIPFNVPESTEDQHIRQVEVRLLMMLALMIQRRQVQVDQGIYYANLIRSARENRMNRSREDGIWFRQTMSQIREQLIQQRQASLATQEQADPRRQTATATPRQQQQASQQQQAPQQQPQQQQEQPQEQEEEQTQEQEEQSHEQEEDQTQQEELQQQHQEMQEQEQRPAQRQMQPYQHHHHHQQSLPDLVASTLPENKPAPKNVVFEVEICPTCYHDHRKFVVLKINDQKPPVKQLSRRSVRNAVDQRSPDNNGEEPQPVVVDERPNRRKGFISLFRSNIDSTIFGAALVIIGWKIFTSQ